MTNTLKPLKRNYKQNMDGNYYSEDTNTGQRIEINQFNAFEQTFEDLRPKLDRNP